MPTPQRIVSLISSATEMLYLLGLGEQVVGVSHECDYPPQIAGKPRLTRSLVESLSTSRAIDDQVRDLAGRQEALYAIDVEQLAQLKPDLILTQAQCDVCAVRYADVVDAVNSTPALAGCQVLALNPLCLQDLLNDLERVGQATGAVETAWAARRTLQARVEQVRAIPATIPAADRPRVACLEWIDPPMLAGNWMPELVEWAGGQTALVEAGRHSSYANWPAIAAFDPEVLVIMPCGFDVERAIVEAQVLPGWDGWNELTAVRSGRVFAVDGNAYFNRSGPRLVDSLEILAHLFHPRRCPLPADAPARMAWKRLRTNEGALVAEWT